jgi:hypothetical protein
MATLEIDVIENRLADLGMTVHYTGNDDNTIYTIYNGSRSIEVIDAVSGDSFKSEDVLEAVLFIDVHHSKDLTEDFAEVETVEDFLNAVTEAFN